MKPKLSLTTVALATLLAAAAPASASHILNQNVTIDGIAPYTFIGTPTLPFFLDSDGLLTLAWDATGESDTAFVTFTQTGGTGLLTPSDIEKGFEGGSQSFSELLNFGSGPGTWQGFVTFDFPASEPDFQYPNGSKASEPSFAFSVEVASVPDGGSTVLLLGAALSGMAWMRRKLG